MSLFFWAVGVIALILGYAGLWHRLNRGKVHLQLEVDRDGYDAGEVYEITSLLENRSWLPIPWIEVTISLPPGLAVWQHEEWSDKLLDHTYLLPRQRVYRHHRIRAMARGMHRVTQARVRFGEGLGIKEVDEALELFVSVLVRPQPATDDAGLVQQLHMEELLGEQSITRWYMEDPSRLAGVRPYREGDVFRNIHWAATARQGNLMVKQMESTTEAHVYFFVNVQCFNPYWMGSNRDVIEYQCQLAALLLQRVEELGYMYGLYSNAAWSGSGWLQIPADGGPLQIRAAMNALGMLQGQASRPFVELLEQVRDTLYDRSTLILLTPYWDEAVEVAVEELRGLGHVPIVMMTASSAAEECDS